MYKTISLYDFREEFHRADRAKQFSYSGLESLFEFLEEVAPSHDLDVVALCCDYSEDSPKAIAAAYDINIEGMNEEQTMNEVLEYLQNNTTVVGCNGSSIVYAQF